MPLIGRIEVPEAFLKRLAENEAHSLLYEALPTGDLKSSDIDVVERELENTRLTFVDELKEEDFIVSLIRVQLNDWYRDTDHIMRSTDYEAIRHEASLLGKKMAYERMAPDSLLMKIAMETIPPDKHPPLSL